MLLQRFGSVVVPAVLKGQNDAMPGNHRLRGPGSLIRPRADLPISNPRCPWVVAAKQSQALRVHKKPARRGHFRREALLHNTLKRIAVTFLAWPEADLFVTTHLARGSRAFQYAPCRG